ncbi:MAG: hypothetical protein KKG33_02405 [candidate division Zixibacteria bacterium]|nr:hypothetical protein [candidate division Zixibacteria bacterium]MBU1470072.1 hypothetical protein [candidate division Zixibacteria bacterium]MBU2624392.1 hypothetical protein [candidate division Zixibacteria bacterium]
MRLFDTVHPAVRLNGDYYIVDIIDEFGISNLLFLVKADDDLSCSQGKSGLGIAIYPRLSI